MKILKQIGFITFAMLMTVVLFTATACAENMDTKARVDVRMELQEILNVLQPINVRQVDMVSKDLFKDFFEHKDKMYDYAAPQAHHHEAGAPAKIHRRTF